VSTRIMRWILAVTAAAATGCGDGSPCDPGQRYERGLCYAPEPEPDAGVASDDAGAMGAAAIAVNGRQAIGAAPPTVPTTDDRRARRGSHP
jgi:hypothetical protein